MRMEARARERERLMTESYDSDEDIVEKKKSKKKTKHKKKKTKIQIIYKKKKKKKKDHKCAAAEKNQLDKDIKVLHYKRHVSELMEDEIAENQHMNDLRQARLKRRLMEQSLFDKYFN